MKKDKQQQLKQALDAIAKKYGDGTVMTFNNESAQKKLDVVSTGSLSLDLALGVGGLPKGRIVEIFGPESSGKTTLALQVAAQAQKAGGLVAFIDAEHALDVTYAQALGINLDEMMISQPDDGEQALEIVATLVNSNSLDVVIIDSVAALTPRAEIEGGMADTHVGLHARLMSRALRKLAGIINQAGTLVIFINQLRMKIGVIYGNPEVTTGGNALKFYSSVRIDVRKGTAIKRGDEVIGNETKAKVVKNKVAPPFRQAIFEIHYGKGVLLSAEVLDLAVEQEIIVKTGAWFSYQGSKIGQGREVARAWLEADPARLQAICKQVTDNIVGLSEETPNEAKPAKTKSAAS